MNILYKYCICKILFYIEILSCYMPTYVLLCIVFIVLMLLPLFNILSCFVIIIAAAYWINCANIAYRHVYFKCCSYEQSKVYLTPKGRI
jgi:hypothetical protein